MEQDRSACQDTRKDRPGEQRKSVFGDVFTTYFDGKAPLPAPTRAADIFVSRSGDGASTWDPRVKVNSDTTDTTHVFPSVQVNKHGVVYTAWIDRRLDAAHNALNDTWAAASTDAGATFGTNVRVTNISTSWYQRADARPNFGDYNSSALINHHRFATVWADGRFPPGPQVGPATPPADRRQTPDTIFAVVEGLPK